MNLDMGVFPPITDIEKPDLDGSLVHGLAWAGGVRWASQLVTWTSTLIVARLLMPEDYGIVGMATVYLGLITLISEFGVGTTVVTLRELSPEHIAQLNGLAILLGFAGLAVSCVVAVPLGMFFASPRLPWVVVAMSTNFVVSSFRSVPAALLQKDLRFKLLSVIEGSKSLSLAIVTVVAAWMGLGYWTLVIGSVAGAIIDTSLTLSRRRCPFARPRPGSLRHAIRFTGHIVISRLAWYSYSSADFVVSGRVLGEKALGVYSLAWNLANIPVDKLAGVLNSVAPALFSAVQTERALLRRYLLNLTEGISLIALPASLGLALAAPEFVVALLGQKWEPAVAPLRLLALFASFRCLAPMIPVALNTIGESRFAMWNSIAAALLMPASFLVASRWGNTGIAAVWLLVYPLVAVPLFHRAFRRMDLRWRDYLSVLRPALAGSLVMAVVVLMLKQSLPPGHAAASRLTVEVLGGGVAYVLTTGMLNFRRRHDVLRILQMLRSPISSPMQSR
jgi:O-antigen/teichoic acid export membrane protein